MNTDTKPETRPGSQHRDNTLDPCNFELSLQHWPILNGLFLWPYLLPLSFEIIPLCPSNGWSLSITFCSLFLISARTCTSSETSLTFFQQQSCYAPHSLLPFVSQRLQLPDIFVHYWFPLTKCRFCVLFTAIFPDPRQFLQHCRCSMKNFWMHGEY